MNTLEFLNEARKLPLGQRERGDARPYRCLPCGGYVKNFRLDAIRRIPRYREGHVEIGENTVTFSTCDKKECISLLIFRPISRGQNVQYVAY